MVVCQACDQQAVVSVPSVMPKAGNRELMEIMFELVLSHSGHCISIFLQEGTG